MNEGGHIYWEDEDGAHTTSKDLYRGIPNAIFIWHGEWADPEILVDGKAYNATEFEEYCWICYRESCEEEGKTPSYEDFDELPVTWFSRRLDEFVFDAD